MIGPGRVALTPLPGFLQRAASRSTVVPVERAAGNLIEQDIASALHLLFDGHRSIREVDIVLCDSFARYVVVPWSDHLSRQSEAEMFAAARFEEVYGDLVNDWTIRVDMRSHGANGIACGIGTELLDQVLHECSSAKVVPRSLRPRFVSAIRQYRRALPENVLVVAPRLDYCVMASIINDDWREVRKLRTGGSEEITQLIMREQSLQGLPKEIPIYFDGVDNSIREHLQESGLNVMEAAVAAAARTDP